jgi:hypothetical protein
VLVHAAVVAQGRQDHGPDEGVEDKLAVREVDAFRSTRRAGGVGEGGLGVLVEVGQALQRRSTGKEVLVLRIDAADIRRGFLVGYEDELTDGGQSRAGSLDGGQEAFVEDAGVNAD